MTNVFIFPANKEVEKGDLVRCVLKSKIGPTLGNLGFCYDRSWFNIRKKFWQSQHLYITDSSEPIKVSDWCMFHGQPSKVFEINGNSAKIVTITIVSDEDAEFINNVKKKKVVKGGDFSTMTHSFSVSQLPKIVASTDKTLNLILITKPFIKSYIEAYNNGKPIQEAEIKSEPRFVILNK